MNDLFFLILFLLATALLFRVDFIYYIVYITLGIFLWSRWFTPKAIKSLHMERKYTDHSYLGETTTITLTLTNRSYIPIPWIQLDESVPVQLRTGEKMNKAFSLSGKSSRSYSYSVRAMRRGFYQLGPGVVTTGDLFGFKEKRAYLQANYLTVYPRIIPVPHFQTKAKLPFGTIRSHQRLFMDPSQPVGTRQFRSGDSLRHINWKVSAHADHLLVKSYRPAMSLETMIYLNLNVREYSHRFKIDGPEWAIIVAASLAANLIDQRQSVGLASNGGDPLSRLTDQSDLKEAFDEKSGRLKTSSIQNGNQKSVGRIEPQELSGQPRIMPNNGRNQLMAILETLARIETHKNISFASWLSTNEISLNWGVTILVISPIGDIEMCRNLHSMRRRGYNPVLLIIEPYTDFRAIERRARPFGIPAIHIANERVLRSWMKPKALITPSSG